MVVLPTELLQLPSFSEHRTRSHKVWLWSCQGTKHTWSDTTIYPRFECYIRGLLAKVVANSIILKPDVFVLLKYDEMSPSFGKIWEVLTFDECTTRTVLVSVQAYTVDYYDSNDSFIVKPSGKIHLALFDSLDYH